ncbi:MAG: hypothetical protein ACJ75S_06980 [Solirubrobacterales bacterium]
MKEDFAERREIVRQFYENKIAELRARLIREQAKLDREEEAKREMSVFTGWSR